MLRGWLCDVLIVLITCYADILLGTDGQEQLQTLMDRLTSVSQDMHDKRRSMQSLDRLRQSISQGRRIELPPVQREHLERRNTFVTQATYDTKHRPVSTNRSRHIHRSRILAESSEVTLHAFMPLKKESGTPKSGPITFLITVGVDGKLSVHTMAGDFFVDSFDLGHQNGTMINHLVLSPNTDRHFVLTADDSGEMRIHSLKVTAKADGRKTSAPPTPAPTPAPKPETRQANMGTVVEGHALESENHIDNVVDAADRTADEVQLTARIHNKLVTVSLSFSCSCRLPLGPEGEVLHLEAVIAVDQDDETFLVAGDSSGGLTVFHRNCQLEGRTKVTEDPGGIRGLSRGRRHQLLFYSYYSFGFFSAQKMTMGYPACTGWNTPLVDVVLDPNHGYTRAFLALQDGDVLVFSTKLDQERVCELQQKFPRVSQLPFKLHMWKGHAVGLQMAPHESEDFRELFFFNVVALDAVHGDVASRIVTAQLNFYPRKLASFAIHGLPGMAPGERSKAFVAVRFFGERGIEISDLTLKQPPRKQSAAEREKQFNWVMIAVVVAILCVVVLYFRKVKVKRVNEDSSNAHTEKDTGNTNSDEQQTSSAGHTSAPEEHQGENNFDDEPKIEEVFDE